MIGFTENLNCILIEIKFSLIIYKFDQDNVA